MFTHWCFFLRTITPLYAAEMLWTLQLVTQNFKMCNWRLRCNAFSLLDEARVWETGFVVSPGAHGCGERMTAPVASFHCQHLAKASIIPPTGRNVNTVKEARSVLVITMNKLLTCWRITFTWKATCTLWSASSGPLNRVRWPPGVH